MRLLVHRLALTCAVVASVVLPLTDATAQPRHIRAPYLDVRFGFNNYGGERGGQAESRLGELTQDGGGGLGLEGGFLLRPRFSLGSYYHVGRFPRILAQADRRSALPSLKRSQSSDWIHMLGLVGRYRFRAPEDRFIPYVQAGITSAFSLLNDQIRTGLGLRVGVGAEMPVADDLFAFTEIDGVLVGPADAMDMADRASGPDPFSFFNVGVRYQPDRFRLPRLRGPRLAKEAAAPLPAVTVTAVEGPEALTTGETGRFTADVAAVTAGTLSYVWDFGDGSTATGVSVEHRYEATGTYTVRFTAVSASGQANWAFPVRVMPPPVMPTVVAALTEPMRPQAGTAVVFKPTLRGTPPFTCRWSFGDGATSDDCEATHVYEAAGRYAIRLDATNAAGTTHRERTVEVYADQCAEPPSLTPVYFDVNSSDLSTDMRAVLRQNASRLANCGTRIVEVRGYAAPGEQMVRALSVARAQAVADYYLTQGVTSQQLTIRGEGAVREVEAGHARWRYRFVESVVQED